MANQIATTIYDQLGGNRFAVMTGSKNFIAGEKSLSMKLSRNSSKSNYLRITLNAMDLYDIEFISIRGASMKTKHSFDGVYCDQLVSIFESTTGLYTKLF